jgi:peptidoglycan/xylan/chitin deacetylase (PgdA/CDA1 family)
MEPPMSAAFICSIDDGHPSDLRMADLLDKHGLNATFFIPVRNREGAPVMPAQQIRELAQRFEIGSHTYDHCFLKGVRIEEAHFQITEGKSRLEDMLGHRVDGFCYPGGKYGPEHADMVQSAGFRYARTTMNLCFDAGGSPYEMPTTVQFYPHDRSVYLRNFAKSGHWLRRGDGLRLAMWHKDWIARLYSLFNHACDRGGVFHLWGHSKDVDELGAWEQLDRFLAHVAGRVAVRDRLDNGKLAAMYF